MRHETALRTLWARVKRHPLARLGPGLITSKKSVMGDLTASRPLRILGWIATAVMGAAAVRMFLPD